MNTKRIKYNAGSLTLTLALLLQKHDVIGMEFDAPILNITNNYTEVSLSNPFNLTCIGFDSLTWEFEISLFSLSLSVDFRKESISHAAGKLFFQSLYSFEGLFESAKTYCDFVNTAAVSSSLCVYIKGMSEPFLNATKVCSSKVEVGLEEKLELSCYVNGDAETKVKWYYNKAPLSIPDNSESLTIVKVDRHHSGLYECRQENESLTEPYSPNWTVIRAMYIPESNVSMETNSDDPTELLCWADGAPLPKITVRSNGPLFDALFEEKFSEADLMAIDNAFQMFVNFMMNESNYFYKCRVKKNIGIGMISGNTTSRKTEGVYIYGTNMKSPTMDAHINERLELFCYADGIPPPHMTWFRNNKSFSDLKVSDDSMKLVITKLVKEHSGLYECRAKNKVGIVSVRTTLHVKGVSAGVSGKMNATETALLVVFVLLVPLVLGAAFFLRRMYCSQQEFSFFPFLCSRSAETTRKATISCSTESKEVTPF